jgi:uncharacterized protein (DUF1501 family)
VHVARIPLPLTQEGACLNKIVSRRKFLQGCSLGIAALAGARLTRAAFAHPGQQAGAEDPILVVVFLRGGWDSLNVAPPLGNDHALYEAARPGLKIPSSNLLALDEAFGLHPAMAPVFDLYQDGAAAFIQAVGLNFDTRSHFDAMEYIELGTPGAKSTPSGWLTRYLQTTGVPDGGIPVASIPAQPTALHGSTYSVSMNQPGDLSQWDNGLLSEQQTALRRLYTGDSLLHQSGLRTLDVLAAVAPWIAEEYAPAPGVAYLDDEFGRQMRGLAQLIKMDGGLRAATVDFGGWDTHEDQNSGAGGYMGGLLDSLARGLSSFYQDLGDAYTHQLTLVVLSEFGRRLVQNDSRGTDHGHGSLMLLLGGALNGGRVYGRWPGLASEQLYDRADLAVTTDYRQVLGELLQYRLGNAQIDQIFPGFQMEEPLGLFER